MNTPMNAKHARSSRVAAASSVRPTTRDAIVWLSLSVKGSQHDPRLETLHSRRTCMDCACGGNCVWSQANALVPDNHTGLDDRSGGGGSPLTFERPNYIDGPNVYAGHRSHFSHRATQAIAVIRVTILEGVAIIRRRHPFTRPQYIRHRR
jgi:hypothetical protein